MKRQTILTSVVMSLALIGAPGLDAAAVGSNNNKVQVKSGIKGSSQPSKRSASKKKRRRLNRRAKKQDQITTSQAAALKSEAEEKKPGNWSFVLRSKTEMGVKENTVTNDDGSTSQQVDSNTQIRFYPKYQWANSFYLAGELRVQKGLSGLQDRDVVVRDGKLKVGYGGWKLNDVFTVSPYGEIAVPFSTKSRRDKTQYSGAQGRGILSYDLAPVGVSWLSGYTFAGFGGNMYEYDATEDQSYNTQWFFNAETGLAAALSSDWSLSTYLWIENGWQFRNPATAQRATTQEYEWAQELSYKINDTFSTSVGHANFAAFEDADGNGNFSFFDKDSSLFFVNFFVSL